MYMIQPNMYVVSTDVRAVPLVASRPRLVSMCDAGSQEAVDDADVAAATAALFSYLERELR